MYDFYVGVICFSVFQQKIIDLEFQNVEITFFTSGHFIFYKKNVPIVQTL